MFKGRKETAWNEDLKKQIDSCLILRGEEILRTQ